MGLDKLRREKSTPLPSRMAKRRNGLRTSTALVPIKNGPRESPAKKIATILAANTAEPHPDWQEGET